MAYFGIDLGTSNCLAAKLEEGIEEGEFYLRCLRDQEGEESFPSVVSFLDPTQYFVGEKALERLYTEPDNTVELIKVRLGKKETIQVYIDGKRIEKSPQEITALILKHLNLHCFGNITNPVLTVPAVFDQSQKDATMQAGSLAQISVSQLIEEPTAAMMYQIFDDYQRNGTDFFGEDTSKTVLVFDFGGGTLDLSLIRLTLEGDAIRPEVLAVDGDSELGGNLIDFVFTDKILTSLAERKPDDSFICQAQQAFAEHYHHYRLRNELRFPDDVPKEIKSFVFRLKRELERVKISLSEREQEKIFVGRSYPPIPIRRGQFEEYILDHTDIDERIHNALQRIIEKSHNIPVNEVLLVGGSAQIPYVQEIILENFRNVHMRREAIRSSSDFSHAVAKGAAIQAALLAGVSIPPFCKNKCSSVVSRDIVLHCGNESITFIPCGTPYPFSEEKTTSFKIPHALSETVSMEIMEKSEDSDGHTSEKRICAYRCHLPIYYTGDEMRISMNIDAAGLYQLRVRHVPTNEEAEFESQKAFSLSEQGFHAASARITAMKDVT